MERTWLPYRRLVIVEIEKLDAKLSFITNLILKPATSSIEIGKYSSQDHIQKLVRKGSHCLEYKHFIMNSVFF